MPRITPIRFAWLLAVATGILLSYEASSRVGELRLVHRDLRARAGILEIRDPSKVYITQIQQPSVPMALQNEIEAVWQYQFYLPPNYGFNLIRHNGLISDDGLICDGGSGSNSSSPHSEPIEGLVTIGIRPDGDGWKASFSYLGGSGSAKIRSNELQSLDEFVMKSIIQEPGKTLEISPDEFFCLIRMHEPKLSRTKTVGSRKIDLFHGLAVWVGPKAQRARMDEARRGKIMLTDKEVSP